MWTASRPAASRQSFRRRRRARAPALAAAQISTPKRDATRTPPAPRRPSAIRHFFRHPDGRPYPWLSYESDEDEDGDERFLSYQPHGASACAQLASLECAVALSRVLRRTLVLPRWRNEP